MARKDVLREEVRRTHGRGLDGLVDAMQHQEEHLTINGTAPSMSYVTAGDGSVTGSSFNTDVAGRIVMHVTLPLTTNILLLTPPLTLIAIGLTTGAVTALLAICTSNTPSSIEILSKSMIY